MKNIIKIGSVLALASVGTAQADLAETKGGIKVRTEDGRFEMSLGGRIHWDAYVFDDDNDLPSTAYTGGTEFRRARLTLAGKLYGWEYRFENDFAGQSGNSGSGFRDMNIATKVGPGKLTLGQFKPYRSMDELTSSNELTTLERAFSSATGIYSGRQYQQGVGYLVAADNYTVGASFFSLSQAGAARNEGLGGAVRATYAPLVSDRSTVHLGLSYSSENLNKGTPTTAATANYAGRRGQALTIGSAGANEEVDFVGVELATVQGPFYAQAEYATGDFGQVTGDDQEVTTYYVQASYHLTGEAKPYNKATGVFRSVKPNNAYGAFEVFARYDFIEREDSTVVTANDGTQDREATSTTLGGTWYVNPNVRFVLAYTIGEGIASFTSGTPAVTTNLADETDQISLRTQLSF